MLNVYILKTYREGEDTFGVEVFEKTIRIGFPTARITAEENVRGIRHDNWIFECLEKHRNTEDKVVFVDTDMIFYEEIESYLESVLCTLAGRYVPCYFNEVVNSNEVDRYHTSLLLINNVKRFFAYIDRVTAAPNYPFHPMAPHTVMLHGATLFFDTTSIAYHTVPKDDREDFPPAILDKYTHLVSGTMLKYVAARMKNGERLKALHERAKSNPLELKGIWREHDMYYFNNPIVYAKKA